MVTRLAAFLRRLDDWLADPETVPFSPVCCPPVTARCEVAGRGSFRLCPPGHTPHNKRGHAMTRTTTEQMERSWLVQRLQKPHGPLGGVFKDNPFSFGGGLKNGGLSADAMDLIREVFTFDYMGAAEFEWGAVPAALRRIAQRHENYIAFTVTVALADVPPNWRDKSGVTPEGDATICVLAEKGSVREVSKRIREWATKPTARLKEQTHLPDALRPDPRYPTQVCGWLELDNGFFFFIDQEMWKRTADLFGIEGAR